MTNEPTEPTFDDALLAGLVRAAGAWAIATNVDLPMGTQQAVLIQRSPALARLLAIKGDGDVAELARGAAGEELATLAASVGATTLRRVRDSGQEAATQEAMALLDSGGADLVVWISRFPDTARVSIMPRNGSLADAVELARLVAAA